MPSRPRCRSQLKVGCCPVAGWMGFSSDSVELVAKRLALEETIDGHSALYGRSQNLQRLREEILCERGDPICGGVGGGRHRSQIRLEEDGGERIPLPAGS